MSEYDPDKGRSEQQDPAPTSGFRKVECPVLPPLVCTWPRCNCDIDLVYAPGLKNVPRR